MAKRVYIETVKKWAIENGIPLGGGLIFVLFFYLAANGFVVILDHSGDTHCGGTEEDPCYAYVTFMPLNDTFIYAFNYDPYGRQGPINFDPGIKEWKLQKKWGSGWRNIPLDKPCTGTWCGAPNNKGEVTYSTVFRAFRTYEFRIVGYKNNPEDIIKWNFFNLDPVWFGPRANFTIIERCWQETVMKDQITVEVQDPCDVYNETNCSKRPTNNFTISTSVPSKNITKCTEIGVSVNGQKILYDQEDKKCLRTGVDVCCWHNSDGGINLDSRAVEFRAVIRSGESGKCLNLVEGLRVTKQRSDVGVMKLTS